MGFLYLLLRSYQPFFSAKRIFRTFFVGMLMGAAVTLLERVLGPPAPAPAVLALFAVLLGLLEALAFAAVLNWRSYRGRRDTPYYGVAFGLGFGASHALFLMFLLLK